MKCLDVVLNSLHPFKYALNSQIALLIIHPILGIGKGEVDSINWCGTNMAAANQPNHLKSTFTMKALSLRS